MRNPGQHDGDAAASRPSSGWHRFARRASHLRADYLLVALDLVLTSTAFAGVLLLRFDGRVPAHWWDQFRHFLPLALALCLVGNGISGVYGQLWRHASVHEAQRILVAGARNLLLVTATNEVLSRPLPLSVAILGTFVGTSLVGASRFQSRLLGSRRRETDRSGLRVIVIGAGDAGAALVHDMLRSPRAGLLPVAILDEDPRHHGRRTMGVVVEGGIDDLERVAADVHAHQAVFAVTSAPPETVRRAAEGAERAGIPLRIVPGLAKMVRGQPSIADVRDLRIEDLVGRAQVSIDLDAVRALTAGKRVLVTGAGGSIGAEITRQVASCKPDLLVLLDHDETHLHDVMATLDAPAVAVLADVRDRRAVVGTFENYRPEVVFHAAAHKHVPLLEQHPCEAVTTNVAGTRNVAEAAATAGTPRLVFISTDKAVQPASVMGASKAVGEQLVLALAPEGAAWCAVRFGNVLGSRGSVVPTFLRQIEEGGPVTVTDERMTRFFMSIEEAVRLVLQAGALATGGDVFLLDMGEPVRIIDLARRMIRLSGRQVGTDVEIRVTGPRPGEKLDETLWSLDEVPEPTAHPSVMRARSRRVARHELFAEVDALERLAADRESAQVADRLLALAGAPRRAVVDLDAPVPDAAGPITRSASWSPSST